MDMNSAPVPGYTQHSCSGGCVGGDIGSVGDLPSLQDIANYNYMTPSQQEQQRQQIQQASQNTFGGMPWRAPSGLAANNASQILPNTQAVQAAQIPQGKKMMPGAQMGQNTQAVLDAQAMPGTQGVQGAQMIQGTTSTPLIPGSTAPITPTTQPFPVTGESLQYLNGFLRTQIGRAVKVSFLIGTNTFQDRSGILMGVGANYILLQEAETDDLLACDFYNIKFVTFYY